MNSGIYFIINLINGKYYVGSAVNLNQRWYFHQYYLNKNLHKNEHLQSAWNKYGSEAFQFTIVEIVNNSNSLIEIEQLWINYSNCYNREIGYNICAVAGSSLGYKHTFETISKLKGRISPFKGKVLSKDHKEKLILGAKKPKSELHKWKLSLANIGKKYSEKTKQKQSTNRKGNLNPNRKINKWPHELGHKCKCTECKEKYRIEKNIRTKRYRNNLIGSWL